MMMQWILFPRCSHAWRIPSSSLTQARVVAVGRSGLSHAERAFSSRRNSSRENEDLDTDSEGRRIRRRGGAAAASETSSAGGWDDFNPTEWQGKEKPSTARNVARWDDSDDTPRTSRREGSFTEPSQRRRSSPPSRNMGGRNDKSQNSWNDRNDNPRPRYENSRPRNESTRNSYRDGPRDRDGPRRFGDDRRGDRRGDDKGLEDRKINLRALEGAGFVHLYGLASVLNALHADRRELEPRSDDGTMNSLAENENDEWSAGSNLDNEQNPQRKPEAQFTTWLFVQDREARGGRSADKTLSANEVERLAAERKIPIAHVDKGVLNTLSGNRPHQGYVLRCGALTFDTLTRIPHPRDDPEAPKLWLVLDEVVDPQNLGALLRSAYFLGGKNNMGVLVCSKNSAPPSPVVSAASAGALELLNVYSTSNLPRTLQAAQDDGFRILGASSSVPREFSSEGATPTLYELHNLPPNDDNRPTLLVLGSEGHGLRTLVAKACTDFVRIPGSNDDADEQETNVVGVDSLNVSVTGGILLWHLLRSTLE